MKGLEVLFIFIITKIVCAQDNHDNACDLLGYSKKLGEGIVKEKPDFLTLLGKPTTKSSSICYLSENSTNASSYTLRDSESTGIDYDTSTQILYTSTSTRVEKKNANLDERKILLDLEDSLVHLYGEIQDIALDWVAKNLYVLQEYALGLITSNNYTSVVSYLATFSDQKTKISFHGAQMLVRPNDGYVFVATNDAIYRFKSDGSDMITLTKNGRRPFAIDDYGSIYYTTRSSSIESMDMHGGSVQVLDVNNIDAESAMAVDRSYVYFVSKTDKGDNLVLRADKFHGNLNHNFVIYGTDVGIKRFVNLKQGRELKRNNPCNFDKGNCVDGFCFVIPQNETKVLQCKGFLMFD